MLVLTPRGRGLLLVDKFLLLEATDAECGLSKTDGTGETEAVPELDIVEGESE